ncbi:MAG: DUF4342 domain-containing protein [Patescibacteria group bacterium]
MTETQEEFKLSAADLVAKVKELIAAGNARRIIIKSETGTSLLEIPLTLGVAGATALALLTPVLAAVGALAGVLTKCSIIVVKNVPEPEAPQEEIRGE